MTVLSLNLADAFNQTDEGLEAKANICQCASQTIRALYQIICQLLLCTFSNKRTMRFLETHSIITRNQEMKQNYYSPLYTLMKAYEMQQEYIYIISINQRL